MEPGMHSCRSGVEGHGRTGVATPERVGGLRRTIPPDPHPVKRFSPRRDGPTLKSAYPEFGYPL